MYITYTYLCASIIIIMILNWIVIKFIGSTLLVFLKHDSHRLTMSRLVTFRVIPTFQNVDELLSTCFRTKHVYVIYSLDSCTYVSHWNLTNIVTFCIILCNYVGMFAFQFCTVCYCNMGWMTPQLYGITCAPISCRRTRHIIIKGTSHCLFGHPCRVHWQALQSLDLLIWSMSEKLHIYSILNTHSTTTRALPVSIWI